MDKRILDIINDKAQKTLIRMPHRKANTYRAMVYAGLRVTNDNLTLQAVAEEMGYSTSSAVCRLVQTYNAKVMEGNVTIQQITDAYNKLRKGKTRKATNAMSSSEITVASLRVRSGEFGVSANERPQETVKLPESPAIRPSVGFRFSQDDELRIKSVIRNSILFMRNYGKGVQPRCNGEYYLPGENPSDNTTDKALWLPLESAAMYCGCNAAVIERAGQNEDIARRVYKKNRNRSYYEYRVDDLDRFRQKEGLS